MVAKSGAQRVKETEARKRAAGLVRFTQWIHPDDAAALREHAAKLAKRRARQAAMQRHDPAFAKEWAALGYTAVCARCGEQKGFHIGGARCPDDAGFFVAAAG